MDISLRSYLAMGTAAVMGAGTMALAPAITTLPALNTHRVVSDNVELAALGTLSYIAGTAFGLNLANGADPISQLSTSLINFESSITGLDLVGFSTSVGNRLRELPSNILGALDFGDLAPFVDSLPVISLLSDLLAAIPTLDPSTIFPTLAGIVNTLSGVIGNIPATVVRLVASALLPDLPEGFLTNGLIGTLGSSFNLLANNEYDISSNESPTINWGPYAMPFSGAGTINDVLGIGGVYPGDSVLGGYTKVGLIPQIIDDGLPILSQVGSNIGDYLSTTFTQLTSGNILAALAYAPTGVIARAGAVLAVLPSILTNLAGSVVGGAGVVINEVVQLVTNVVTELSALNVLGAVGAVRSGLLGPSGIPGALVNLTIGAGVQTGPVGFPQDIADNFVPSTRTVVQQGVKDIAAALATPVPGAVASVTAPQAASVSAPEASSVASRARSVEVPHAEVTKAEVTKAVDPKSEATTVEVPKVDAPRAEVPKVEVTESEAPKVEAPTTPKAEEAATTVKDRVAKRGDRSAR